MAPEEIEKEDPDRGWQPLLEDKLYGEAAVILRPLVDRVRSGRDRFEYLFLLGRLIECLANLGDDEATLHLCNEAIGADSDILNCYEHAAAIFARRGGTREVRHLATEMVQREKTKNGWAYPSAVALFAIASRAALEAAKLEAALDLACEGESWCAGRGLLGERFWLIEIQGKILEKSGQVQAAKQVYERAISSEFPLESANKRYLIPLESICKRYMVLLGKEKGHDDEIRRVANLVLAGGFSAAAEFNARKRLARLLETPQRRSATRGAILPFSARIGPTPKVLARTKRPYVRESIVTPTGWVLGGGLGGGSSIAGFLSIVRPGTLGGFEDVWELNVSTGIGGVVALGDLLVAYGSGENSTLIFVDSSGGIRATYVPDGRITRVAVGGTKVFVGSTDGSLTCLDADAKPQWKHVVPGAGTFRGSEHFRPCPGDIDCTADGGRVAYAYATAYTAFSNLVSLCGDTGIPEWQSRMAMARQWRYEGFTMRVETPGFGQGMAFAPSGSLFYNSRGWGCVEFDAKGNVLTVRKIADGGAVKDTSGRIRGLMYPDGLTLVDELMNAVGHVPCEAAWKVRFHDDDKMLALVDGKNVTVASSSGDVLAKVECSANVNTIEWWQRDLLVSTGSDLLRLSYQHAF